MHNKSVLARVIPKGRENWLAEAAILVSFNKNACRYANNKSTCHDNMKVNCKNKTVFHGLPPYKHFAA